MTVVRPNSISGINSITVQTGQALNIHDASGNLIRSLTNESGISTFSGINVGTALTIQDNGNIAVTGIVTAASYIGDGSALTGIAGTEISNSDFAVGVSTFFVDYETGRVGVGTINPQVRLTVSSDSPAVMDVHHVDGGTNDEARIILGALALNPPSNRGAGIAAVNNGAGHDLIIKCSASHSAGPTEKLRIDSTGDVRFAGTNLTDNTNKNVNLTAPSYDTDEEDVNLVQVENESATNQISFGGGTGALNAATNIRFLTASAVNTTTGTERLRIQNDGRISIASSIAVTGVTTAAAFIPSKGQLSNRNIAINGAMQVAQRDTSNTNDQQGYKTCDRFTVSWSGLDSVVEQHQVTLTSGTPYNLGFRHAWQLKNGNQTGGADAGDYIQAEYRIEGRDIAQSGWDYVSSSSYITLSFWLKTSVQQDFTINFTSFDGTSQRYPMKTGTIAANTWTKITKTVPGGSNVQFDNDTGKGMAIMFYPYLGNSYVGGSSLNTWSAASTPNFGGSNESAWYTTDDATFEVTGFQLEVGEHATPFEHRSFAEDLRRCQRYFQRLPVSGDHVMWGFGRAESNSARVQVPLSVPLRASPTLTCSNNRSVKYDATMVSSTSSPSVFKWDDDFASIIIDFPSGGSLSHNNCYIVTSDGGSTGFQMDSEI